MSATHFRSLHQSLLLLPNAFDVMSARLAESAGAKAVATSSAALAWSLGYRDGQALPFGALVRAVESMTRLLRVPLTIDVERGYADEPEQVAKNVRRLVEAGAVGINLEDDAKPPATLVAKIEAIRARLTRDHVFINARTCVVLNNAVEPNNVVSEVTLRGRLYEAAGADGFFVPRLIEPTALKAVTGATTLPVNAIVMATGPTVTELTQLGVRRVSLGPRLGEVAYSAAATALSAFLGGSVEPFRNLPVTFSALEGLIAPSR